ncbi:hypothetical protein [Kibdelosporangium philippinense]|uniref:hypothetical protein n=1 Tax=Kibdelosporangium philippinense TaxID=211113 RepID=UPI003613F949
MTVTTCPPLTSLRHHGYPGEHAPTRSGHTRPATLLGGPRRRLTGTPAGLLDLGW